MGVRFLHTSDWQLGMSRGFLSAESKSRYRDDQIGAIRRLAAIAAERGCSFVVVAGDVFDTLQVERQMLGRTLEALTSFQVPVYLLPGNHDADNPSAVWSRGAAQLPPLVHALRDSAPIRVPDVDAEIVGAPWPSRRPDIDLVAASLDTLEPTPSGLFRIAVGHGAVDTLSPDPSNPAQISVDNLERALDRGLVHYVALGDRHSATCVLERVWYSGAPLSTDFDEMDPNTALVVALGPGTISVERVEVGAWHFRRQEFDLSGPESVDLVSSYLSGLQEKERTVVRLALRGTISLSTNELLEQVLEKASDLLAGLTRSEARSDLVVVVDEADLKQLDLSGFAGRAVAELAESAAGSGEAAPSARDALMLMRRLASRSR